MAVLHRTPARLPLPADFGIGVAIVALLSGFIILAAAAATAIPSGGPRGEARPPTGEYYQDIAPPTAPGPAVLPTR